MIEIKDNLIRIGTNLIDIKLCMEMKSMVPVMSFSQVLRAFSSGDIISTADFDEAINILDKRWLTLSPEDVEWDVLDDPQTA